MKIDDLVMLIKAGYTKADIEALGIALGADPAEPEQAAPAEPENEPEQAAPAEPKPTAQDDHITSLESKLDYVINRMNYMAVKNSNQPAAPAQSVDDILASVVRGNKKPDKE